MDIKNLYVVSILVLCLIAVGAMLVIIVTQPLENAISLIGVVVGFITLPMVTLLALAQRELGIKVDGRLTQVLALQARASKAEGVLEGVKAEKENPS